MLTGEGPPQDGFGIQKIGSLNVYMRKLPTPSMRRPRPYQRRKLKASITGNRGRRF